MKVSWTAFELPSRIAIEGRSYFHSSPFIFAEDLVGPETLFYRGMLYLRFMDFIYHIKHPSNWTHDEILHACAIRRTYGDGAINRALNIEIAQIMNSGIKHLTVGPLSKIVEIGCGDGRFSHYLLRDLPGLIIGLDADYEALQQYKSGGRQAILGELTLLPFQKNSMDVCAAMFVFHFKYLWQAIADIHVVLGAGGLFVLNYYGPEERELLQCAERAGFTLIRRDKPRTALAHQVLFFMATTPPPSSGNG
jgi:SAM-dependent methyltransferase